MGSDSNVITITIYPHKHCGQAVNFSKSELHKKRKWSPRPTTRGGVPAPVPNPAGSCVANAMTCSFLHITAPERGGGSVRGLSAERWAETLDIWCWTLVAAVYGHLCTFASLNLLHCCNFMHICVCLPNDLQKSEKKNEPNLFFGYMYM